MIETQTFNKELIMNSKDMKMYELKNLISKGTPVSKIVEYFNGFYTYAEIKKEEQKFKKSKGE
jgi:hypothetical protein